MCRKRRQLYWYTTLCPIYFFLGFLSQTAGRQVWKKILFSEKMSLVVPPNFQHILRVLNTNIEGKVNIMFALTSIKVSYVLANFFLSALQWLKNSYCTSPVQIEDLFLKKFFEIVQRSYKKLVKSHWVTSYRIAFIVSQQKQTVTIVLKKNRN